MAQFLIRYRFKEGTQADWHREIAKFITALNEDPELKGRIAYRCMKRRDGTDYFHLATTMDDQAAKVLQGRNYFPGYQDETKRVAGGEVEVVPLEIVAETNFRG